MFALKGFRLYRPPDFLGDDESSARIYLRENEGEFLSSIPRDKVNIAYGALNHRRQRHQRLIPGEMPVRIIVLLKIIDVHHN